MNSKLKRLQAMNNKVALMEQAVTKDVLQSIRAKLAQRGYRADLCLVTASKCTKGSFSAEVKFQASLGHPDEDDLITLVAQNYPNHQIDWETAQVDPEAGVVVIQLDPQVEVVPVSKIDQIPAEFVGIGAGIYKRAVDTTGNVMEIWTLRKSDDGSLALLRNKDDLEVTAKEDEYRAGDVVNTPQGPGRILRFDEVGNAFVQVGNKKHLVCASELEDYSIDSERSKLETYYAEIYGAEYAKELVRKQEQIQTDMWNQKTKQSK